MTTEVSSTSFDQNLQLNGINVPTFNVRRAQTTVEMASGSTLMIAGLLESNTISGLTQLPGVKDVPVLGDLIKSDTFNRDESEVVVIITPYLVQPYANNNAGQHQGSLPQQEPSRDPNQLGSVFGNKIRRTYGTSAPETQMKEAGSFGYITE
jgi:pilus assembly protein CpaC